VEGLHNIQEMNTITASEQLNMAHKAVRPTMSAMSGGTEAASSAIQGGIRVEQLCDILSREISRVREESV